MVATTDPLAGEVALVTGAAEGIGLTAVRTLLKAGSDSDPHGVSLSDA